VTLLLLYSTAHQQTAGMSMIDLGDLNGRGRGGPGITFVRRHGICVAFR
jgi:hypothetical protein